MPRNTNHIDHVNRLWDEMIIDPINVWLRFSPEEKILSLYRASQEQRTLNKLKSFLNENEHTLVLCALLIFFEKSNSFLVVHEKFIKFITECIVLNLQN